MIANFENLSPFIGLDPEKIFSQTMATYHPAQSESENLWWQVVEIVAGELGALMAANSILQTFVMN